MTGRVDTQAHFEENSKKVKMKSQERKNNFFGKLLKKR